MFDPFTENLTSTLVAPSVLAIDFARLGEQANQVLTAGADLLHVDIMDGHFVPNLSMGPAVCGACRKACPDAYLDVHLMVTDPQMFFKPFQQEGANAISFHIERMESEAQIREYAHEVRELGCQPGIVLNPPTHHDEIIPIIDAFDFVLIMSVHPGFGGQSFISEVLEKAKHIKPILKPHQRLEIDGGINPQTAILAREAGCDMLVAGSAIFGQPQDQWANIINEIRG